MGNYIEDVYKKWEGKTIAVVGNGTPSRPWGAEIDNHDVVIRCNISWTEGYEELVGSKTTCITLGALGLINHIPEIDTSVKYLFSYYNKDTVPAKGNKYKPRHLMWESMVNLIGGRCRKPTAGFRALFHMWRNGIGADVYGFTFYRTPAYYLKRQGEISSFFTTHPQDAENPIHDALAELEVWRKLRWHKFKDGL